MNVVLDILGSLMLRGSMIAILLNLNVHLHDMLYKKTSSAALRQGLRETADILTADLTQVGYNVSSAPALRVAKADEINFLADIDNNATVDTVHYRLGPTSELSETENPNDRKLYRKVNSGEWFDLSSGIRTLNLQYFDGSGMLDNDLSDIRSIFVKVVMENGYAIDGVYPSSYWQSRVFPRNIK